MTLLKSDERFLKERSYEPKSGESSHELNSKEESEEKAKLSNREINALIKKKQTPLTYQNLEKDSHQHFRSKLSK